MQNRLLAAFICVVLLAALSACSRPLPETTPFDHYLSQGDQHMQSGEYQQAKDAYENAIMCDESDPRGYLCAAVAYRVIGEYKNAEDVLREGINIKAVAKEDKPLIREALYELRRFIDDLSYVNLFGERYPLSVDYINLSPDRPLSSYDRDGLDQISKFTGVNHASLSGQYIFEDLSFLAELPGLKSLFITIPDGITPDLSPLSSLTTLETLNIAHSGDFDLQPTMLDLSTFASMSGLQSLMISWFTVSDLSPLTGLTKLTTLSLRISGRRACDLSPLAGLRALSFLSLGYTDNCDISTLSGLPELRMFSLEYGGNCDLSPLASLPELAWLSITCTLPADSIRLTLPPKLSDLSVNHFFNAYHPVEFEIKGGVDSLVSLFISGGISDLSFIAGAANLYQLEVFGGQLSDLSPLAGLDNLSYLSLANCGISDLNTLPVLARLQTLNLAENNITNLRPLSKLPLLELLGILRNPVTDFSPLNPRVQIVDTFG